MIHLSWWIPLGLTLVGLISWLLKPSAQRALRLIAIGYLLATGISWWLGYWVPQNAVGGWYFATVGVFGILGIWYSGPYIEREASIHHWTQRQVRTYYALFYIFITSMIAIALWSNFLFLWMAIEAATLTSVVLVAVEERSHSLEAAWKYLFVTEIGGLIALVGTIMALSAVGIPLGSWNLVAPAHHTAIATHWALIGAYMALIGYGAKAGLAPFHTWLPDAHSEAPAPVSALLSGLKLAGGVIIIYRLFTALETILPPLYLKDALIVLGLLSLVIASAFIAFQKDLKRLWAYSSIEHIGLIALGVGFGGIALIGAMLHIFTHASTKTLLFHNAGTVRLLYGTSDSLHGARGLMMRTPVTGTLLALGAAAIVGLPPFAPFWSEWLILAGGFQNPSNRLFVAIAAALVVIIFIAIARRLPEWLFTPGPADQTVRLPIREPMVLLMPMLVLGVLVVGSGIGVPIIAHSLWIHMVSEVHRSHI